jgi:short-subunit dehydrogenase
VNENKLDKNYARAVTEVLEFPQRSGCHWIGQGRLAAKTTIRPILATLGLDPRPKNPRSATLADVARQPKLPLKNSVALVTGAAGGIGGALARNLARRGCHLALTDLKAAPLSETAAAARALGVTVSEHVFDIADSAAIAAFPAVVEAQHGRLTVLCNCAGVALGGTFAQVSLEEFDWLFQINFWSVVRMMKAFMPMLEREPEAQIVNISSLFGLIGPPGQAAYASSKFAVRGVSEVVRHELDLAGKHIGVTVVHPAGVRTGIAKNARLAAALPKEEAERMDGIWEKFLTDSPDSVAETIITGVERRQRRILCAKDAARIDRIQRLMPVGYWDLFRRRLLKEGKSK